MESLDFDEEANRNLGLFSRRDIIGASKEINLIGRLNADFFLQNRYLLDNTDLTIKIL